MKIGSESHKQLFCQSFMESHLKYEPEQLPWPDLDEVSLQRLRSIPFWEEALYTERNAGVMVKAFAETVSDPVIQEAIALQGYEEARHARTIEFLIEHYGIEINTRPERQVPANIEQAFIDFGYSECLDSFFAFGLFGVARPTGYLPEQLFTIFDPILHEEARHILFFVNWVAYLQINRGAGVLRGVHSLWHYGKALREMLGIVSSGSNKNGEGFTATGATSFDVDLTLEKFLSTCIQENEKRMSAFDEQLLRPSLLPSLAKIAYRTLKFLPKREVNPAKRLSPS